MNLRDLEYLVAVADAHSFRAAARDLDVSQPTLSAQIKKLESELGVALFDRSVAPLALTAVGERVVARSRVVLDQVSELRADAATDADAEGGVLRLGMFPTLGPYLLPHVVSGVRQAFPNLKLLLTEEKSSDLLAMLEAGRLDAVALAMPVTAPGLHVEPLFREELLLAVPGGHALASAPTPVPPSALADTDILCLGEGHCLADQVTDWLASVGGRRRADFRATSLETLRSMISAGGAVSLLPALTVVAPVAQASGVELRRFSEPAPSRDIALVWRGGSPQAVLLAKLAPYLVPVDLPDNLVLPLLQVDAHRRASGE